MTAAETLNFYSDFNVLEAPTPTPAPVDLKAPYIAPRHLLSDEFVAGFAEKSPPWGPFGEVTYLRSYSQYLASEGRYERWHETVRRVVEFSFALYRGPASRLELTSEAQRLFTLIWNLKGFPAGRTLWLGGMPMSYTQAGAPTNFNCLERGTEFLTDQGLRTFHDFEDGDTVTVLSQNGKWRTATVRNFGQAQLYRLTLGRGNETREIYATANHRWVVYPESGHNPGQKIKTTGELRLPIQQPSGKIVSGDKLVTNRLHARHAIQPCSVARQHGLVFGDGTYDKKTGRTSIALHGDSVQFAAHFDPDKRIRQGAYKEDPTSYRGSEVFTRLPWNWKKLPPLDANPEYLLGFLQGWFAADGHTSEAATPILHSSSREHLDWARSAFELVGITTTQVSLTRELSPFDGSEKPLYAIRLHSESIPEGFFLKDTHREGFAQRSNSPLKWRVLNVEPTDRVEDVWCVQEPETETFTLAGGLLTKNCAFTDIRELADYSEMVLLLMGGSGVGFRVTQDCVAALNGAAPFRSAKLPELVVDEYEYAGVPGTLENTVSGVQLYAHRGPTRDMKRELVLTVGDSREGWAQFVEQFLRALTVNDLQVSRVRVNVNRVRPLGSALKTFGGQASGPGPLIDFANDAYRVLSGLVDGQAGAWTDLKMLDIANMVGRMVVAGGTRRSAQIALGDSPEFAGAKTGNWWEFAPWRSQSNNTVVFAGAEPPSVEQLREYFRQIMQFGEPGFLNEYAAGLRRPEFRGINPCAEILLGNKGFCNLVTPNWMAFLTQNLYGPTLDVAALMDALYLLTRHNLRITNVDMSAVLPQWHERQQKERLLGVSFTGFGDAVDATGMGPREQRELFRALREHVHQTGNLYADEMGVPRPLLMTTVKPEGSISTLPGVSSGLHAPYAPKYLRRVRVASMNVVAKALVSAGFEPEPEFGQGTLEEANTWVFTFPVQTPARRTAHSYSAIEQLERYALIQNNWTDHNSSITVYISQDEVEEVIAWLRRNWSSYVAVSFLPKNDQTYPLMPYEAVDELPDLPGHVEDVRAWVDVLTLQGGTVTDDLEGCETGACPVR